MRRPPFAVLSAPLTPLAELGDGEQTPFVPVRNCQMLEGSNLQEVQTRIKAVRVFVPRKHLALSVWLGKRKHEIIGLDSRKIITAAHKTCCTDETYRQSIPAVQHSAGRRTSRNILGCVTEGETEERTVSPSAICSDRYCAAMAVISAIICCLTSSLDSR